jgi:hypothetical protein
VASHFSSVGFPIETQEAFAALALRAAESGERRGDYIRWAPSEGVELWAQVHGSDVIGLNPHFAGSARMDVAITGRIEGSGHTPLDGSFQAWADPQDPEKPESGDFPFVFDVPDAALLDVPRFPLVARLQLALFAHNFEWHRDDEAFDAAKEQPGFAAESFIPTGMFAEGTPQADALAHGHLLEGGRRTNAETGLGFWSGRVRTLGGEVDVVADVEMVGGDPPVGAVLVVAGWLSGRVDETR